MSIDNKPTWSYSTYNIFKTCKRSYFYDKYWDRSPDKWKAFRLKYITNIPMLMGNTIHSIIQKAILRRKNGLELMSLSDAKLILRRDFRNAYNESSKGYWRDPKKFGKKTSDTCNLFEHYYKVPEILKKAQESEANGIKSLENIWNSDIWARIMTLEKQDFMTIDDPNFPSFYLDGIKIYAVIDLAINYNGSKIIDWKTGAKNPANHTQLAIYGLYAKSEWKWKPEDIVFFLAYTQEDFEFEKIRITEEDLNQAQDIITDSYKEMQKLYNNGEPNINDFSKVDNLNICEKCKYKEICLEIKSEI